MGSQFAVYILHSPSRDRYYIGQTSDFSLRASEHLAGHTRSTCMARDWKLVFLERVGTLQAAMELERRIKRTKSRKSIERYIRDPRNTVTEPVPLEDYLDGV